MKKKLYLHIGTHKTGTTYLQSIMIQNRFNLLKQGFLFPRSGILPPPFQHFVLAARFMPEETYRAMGINTPLSLIYPKNKELYWDQLISEIKQIPSHSIILSSEHFSLIKDLDLLKEKLSEFEVKIIIYIRKQDEFYASLHNQLLKNPFCVLDTSINQFIRERELAHPSYKTILDRWSNAFGKRNLFVRVYEREQLTNGLLSDFASITGIKTDSFSGVNSTINFGLPGHAIRFIQLHKQSSTPNNILANKEIATFMYELSKASFTKKKQHKTSSLPSY